MSHSKLHKQFAYSLNDVYSINEQDVLDYPEKYLGPNYREVLNFWFYRESLYYKQWKVYDKSRISLDYESRVKAHNTAEELASEVIDPRFIDFLYGELTCEVTAAHFYLERNIPFTFLPFLLDSSVFIQSN
jgi:hypothetical protein